MKNIDSSFLCKGCAILTNIFQFYVSIYMYGTNNDHRIHVPDSDLQLINLFFYFTDSIMHLP